MSFCCMPVSQTCRTLDTKPSLHLKTLLNLHSCAFSPSSSQDLQTKARRSNAFSRNCRAQRRRRCLLCRAESGASANSLEPVAQSITAIAPATVANLGPGFDWLGCAVEVSMNSCQESKVQRLCDGESQVLLQNFEKSIKLYQTSNHTQHNTLYGEYIHSFIPIIQSEL